MVVCITEIATNVDELKKIRKEFKWKAKRETEAKENAWALIGRKRNI